MPWYRSSEGLFFCFFCSFNPEVEAWNLSDIFLQLECCFPPVLLKDFSLIDLYKNRSRCHLLTVCVRADSPTERERERSSFLFSCVWISMSRCHTCSLFLSWNHWRQTKRIAMMTTHVDVSELLLRRIPSNAIRHRHSTSRSDKFICISLM